MKEVENKKEIVKEQLLNARVHLMALILSLIAIGSGTAKLAVGGKEETFFYELGFYMSAGLFFLVAIVLIKMELLTNKLKEFKNARK